MTVSLQLGSPGQADGGLTGCSLLSSSSQELISVSFSLQQGQFCAAGSCLQLRSLEAASEMFWQGSCSSRPGL